MKLLQHGRLTFAGSSASLIQSVCLFACRLLVSVSLPFSFTFFSLPPLLIIFVFFFFFLSFFFCFLKWTTKIRQPQTVNTAAAAKPPFRLCTLLHSGAIHFRVCQSVKSVSTATTATTTRKRKKPCVSSPSAVASTHLQVNDFNEKEEDGQSVERHFILH